MRPAARILLVESEALPAVLESAPAGYADLPTVCTGWSVRDVLAHCGAALTAAADGTTHSFSAADNQRDVDLRRRWPLGEVIAELVDGYVAAAQAIDAAGGRLDGLGIGEWMHGGDVRDAIGAPLPYTSVGVDLAVALLLERSVTQEAPRVDIVIGRRTVRFGAGELAGTAATDLETFVRLCGGRRPEAERYQLDGITAEDLVLFR